MNYFTSNSNLSEYERKTLANQRAQVMVMACAAVLAGYVAANKDTGPAPATQSPPPIVCPAPLPRIVPVTTASAAPRVIVRFEGVVI